MEGIKIINVFIGVCRCEHPFPCDAVTHTLSSSLGYFARFLVLPAVRTSAVQSEATSNTITSSLFAVSWVLWFGKSGVRSSCPLPESPLCQNSRREAVTSLAFTPGRLSVSRAQTCPLTPSLDRPLRGRRSAVSRHPRPWPPGQFTAPPGLSGYCRFL